MAKKNKFMIAHGASVVVVREGKRVTIQPGGGADFTEEEIATIGRTAPGALRVPVNEGTRIKTKAETDAEDAEDEDGDEGEGKPETAKQKTARLAREAKAAEAAKGKAKDKAKADDADEDEDI